MCGDEEHNDWFFIPQSDFNAVVQRDFGLLGKGPPSEWKRRMNIQKCSHLIPGIYCHSCSIQFIIYGGPMERDLLDSSTWGTVVQLHQGSNILWVQTLLFFYCNYCTKQGEIWCSQILDNMWLLQTNIHIYVWGICQNLKRLSWYSYLIFL